MTPRISISELISEPQGMKTQLQGDQGCAGAQACAGTLEGAQSGPGWEALGGICCKTLFLCSVFQLSRAEGAASLTWNLWSARRDEYKPRSKSTPTTPVTPASVQRGELCACQKKHPQVLGGHSCKGQVHTSYSFLGLGQSLQTQRAGNMKKAGPAQGVSRRTRGQGVSEARLKFLLLLLHPSASLDTHHVQPERCLKPPHRSMLPCSVLQPEGGACHSRDQSAFT